MERRMLLAVVLSFLAVTLYSVTTGRGCMPQPPEDPDKNGVEAPEDPNGEQPETPNGEKPVKPNGGNGNGDQPEVPPPSPAEPTEGHPHAEVPATTARLESDELDVVFTSRGGSIESVLLKNHTDVDGEPLYLVVPADDSFLMGQTDDTHLEPKFAPGDAFRKNLPIGPMRQLHWRLDTARTQATEDDDVVFTWTDTKGRTWTKRWVLAQGEDRYDIRLFLSVKGEAGEVDVKVLASAGMLDPRETEDMFFKAKKTVYFTSDMGEVVSEDQNLTFGAPLREIETSGIAPVRLRLLGARSLYFTALYFGGGDPEQDLVVKRFWATGEQADLRGEMAEALDAWSDAPSKNPDGSLSTFGKRVEYSVDNMQQAWFVTTVPVAPEAPEVEMAFFTGPIARQTLGQDVYESIEPMITYPFAPDFVADALLGIYDLWRSLFGSVGLAVILMTLTVRGLLMPISIKNQLGMRQYSRKIKKIKPKIDALQEKYPKNPQKLREEQMKLYREHGIGFPSGCLMMLFQMPIWFSLFSALRREFTLRGAEFLWIKDLSGPDTLIDFGQCYQLLFFTACGINLLPILMIILSIIHTRSMPKPQDEQTAQQYRMMRWFPIIFAIILYNYTAALMLYMTLSSAVGILESRIVRAKDEKLAAEEGPATAWVAEGK